jgi:hypothetical protein
MSIPRIPLLKRCNLDLDTSIPRNRCHPGIRLRTGHLQSRSNNSCAAIPVPHPTSSTLDGARLIRKSMRSSG